MNLKDFLNKVNIKGYTIVVIWDGLDLDVKTVHYGTSRCYIEFGATSYTLLKYSQEIQLTDEGIQVKDEEDNEIELRFYRRELVDMSKLIN